MSGLRPMVSGAAALAVAIGGGIGAAAASEVRVVVSYYSAQTGPIFEGMAEVYAALSQASLARRHPEELASDLALTDVLDGLAPPSGRRGEPLP